MLKSSRSDKDIWKTWVAAESDHHIFHLSGTSGNGGTYG